MSSSKANFSQAELGNLKVWDVPDVAIEKSKGFNLNLTQKEPDSPEDQTPPSQILTVEEIETMQDQAYLESFQQGETKGYEAGYEKGYAEGSSKGYDENLKLLEGQGQQLNNLMSTLNEPFKALDEQVEQELVKLALGVAAQIIRREIKTDPGQVIGAVREAISVLPSSSRKIVLHLHPEDAVLVRSALALDEMSPAWEIFEEPLITRGGCKVHTETSRIDATVENRLAAVIANVLGDQREHDKAE